MLKLRPTVLLSFHSKRLSSRLSASTDVVVCGGGLAGTSIAYHLARRGKRVCLIEKSSVGGGGASAVCGGVVSAPLLWEDVTCQHIAKRSHLLYEELADNKGFEYTKCGRLHVASSDRTHLALQRLHSRAKVLGGAELLEADDVQRLIPFMNAQNIRSALLSTEEVVLDAVALCRELAAEAALAGAVVQEGVSVVEVLLGHDRQVYAVDTSEGLIETPVFVDAAGVWSGHFGVRSLPHGRLQMAAAAAVLQHLVLGALPSYAGQVPMLFDMDENVLVQAGRNGTVVSGFSEECVRASSVKDRHASLSSVPHSLQDWDAFQSVMGSALRRVPLLSSMKMGELVAVEEAYSPDAMCTIGESSQAKGYFVAGSFCGQGLSLCGGVGEVLSEWIVDGAPSVDVSRIDVARFLELHTNPQYLQERTPEVASLTYRTFRNGYQFHSARNLRMSPIYHQLKAAGAVFGETMGYERPLWFEPKLPRKSLFSGTLAHSYSPPWMEYVADEYRACRERVALIDMSSFTKFEISGADSVSLLQYLCSADIDRPVGTTVFTGMQNERGGYVSDCTLSRISHDTFFMVAPTVQQDRVYQWMSRWAHTLRKNVHIQDVTAMYTALDVVGPLSRHLLSDLTHDTITPSSFPNFRYKEINIGMATGIRAISVTHCGELGWMIYIPNEQAQYVYERIVEGGKEYSLQHAGYYTLRHLRIEKFYVYWGQDIDATVTPVECGRSFRVHLQKDFIGKSAMEKQLEEGIYKRFVHVMVDGLDVDRDISPIGGECILRDGVVVGRTTSSAHAFTLACQVCIGVVGSNDGITMPFLTSGHWQLDIAGKLYTVRISPHSPSLPMESSEHPQHYRPTQ